MQNIAINHVIENFEELCETTYQQHEPCIIRRHNQHDIVIMSLNDFNSWQETEYLLSNPYNAQRLLHSLEQARNGKLQSHELIAE